MTTAWIVDAARTPRGRGKKDKGALSGIHPQELLAQTLNALAERTGIDVHPGRKRPRAASAKAKSVRVGKRDDIIRRSGREFQRAAADQTAHAGRIAVRFGGAGGPQDAVLTVSRVIGHRLA